MRQIEGIGFFHLLEDCLILHYKIDKSIHRLILGSFDKELLIEGAEYFTPKNCNDILYSIEYNIHRFKNSTYEHLLTSEGNIFYSIARNLINGKYSIRENKRDDFRNPLQYLIDDQNKIIKMPGLLNPVFEIGDKYYSGVRYNVTCRDIDCNILWDSDIRDRGCYIDLQGNKQLNKIEWSILPCAGNVLVPLKGGQLLALDGETGGDVWIWSDGDISGKYGSDNEFIYKIQKYDLIKIDGINGKTVVKKNILKDPVHERFYSSGCVWVRGDYVILADVVRGRIAIYNKEDLSLFKYFEIDSRIPNSESPIQVKDNLLFILGMDHTLRIYNLNEWKG